MEWLLTRLFGPRERIVVETDGQYLTIHQTLLGAGDRLIQADLRHGAAQRIARLLRYVREDMPEPFL